MRKILDNSLFKAGLVVLALFGLIAFPLISPVSAGNEGSVKTVADCANVNDNPFSVGQTVKGKGDNFIAGKDYRWTIEKVDSPNQGDQVAHGSFSLGAGETSFCRDLWTADILGGDIHSEFKWEVERNDPKTVRGHLEDDWKKVDSDNFFVDGVPAATPTDEPTTAPTATPTDEPTPTPTDPGETPSPTPTPTPTATPTDEPTATPTATPAPTDSNSGTGGSSSNSNSGSTSTTQGQVLGATTLAATGSFEENLYSLSFVAGLIFLGLGIMKYARLQK